MNTYHCEVTYTPSTAVPDGPHLLFVCDVEADDTKTANDVARRQCQRRRKPDEIHTSVCALQAAAA